MNIGKKIELIKGDMTYQDFAQDIFNKTGHEIHWTTLQKYITGQRRPSLRTLDILAEYSNNPVSYFVEDNKELKDKVIRLEKLKSLKKDYDELTKIKEIPILGNVPAGNPNLQFETDEGFYPIPAVLYKGESFALRIRGDSMIGVGIEDGDLVLVRQQPVAEIGQTVIARIGDEVTCKRFYVRNGKPVLEPANSKYKTIEPDELEIIGVVTKMIREFE